MAGSAQYPHNTEGKGSRPEEKTNFSIFSPRARPWVCYYVATYARAHCHCYDSAPPRLRPPLPRSPRARLRGLERGGAVCSSP
eukprot:scaffold65805_cov31-Tisochrysis_lutea.AAC.1